MGIFYSSRPGGSEEGILEEITWDGRYLILFTRTCGSDFKECLVTE